MRSTPRRFWFGAAAVLALFASSLIELVGLSMSGPLYSHIVLIPTISLTLCSRDQKRDQRTVDSGQWTVLGIILIATGIVVYWVFGLRLLGTDAAIESRLAWQVGAFLLTFWGVCLATLLCSTCLPDPKCGF
jgi:hypothetical protein